MRIEKNKEEREVFTIKESVKISQDNFDVILKEGDKIEIISQKKDLKEMNDDKIGRYIRVDGKYTDLWAVLYIDSTHVYLSRYTEKLPSEEEIKAKGAVFHIAQIRGMSYELHGAIEKWLKGRGTLDSEVFRY